MGAGSSSLPVNQHRTWSVEPPPLPAPPFLTGCRSPSSETSTITRDIEVAAEDVANKASSAAFDGPDSQLAYAPEIVGWPPTGRMATEEQQERLDLTRTVSHLAAATQQLATAQNVTLMHLESVYDELKREREGRRAVLERRQKWVEKEANKNYDQHMRGLDYQVTNLDTLSNERLSSQNQRKILRNLDTDLRDHLDNAAQSLREETDDNFAENVFDHEDQGEFTPKMRQDCYPTLDHDEDSDKRKIQRHACLIGKKTVASKLARKFKKFDQVAGNSSCRRVTIAKNETEVHDKKLLKDENYQDSRNRNEEAPLDLRSERLIHKIAKLGTRKRPLHKNERMNRDGVSFLDLGYDDLTDVQEVDDSRDRLINARLKNHLEAQQRVIDKLNEDYEVSKQEYKLTEDSLVERTEQISQLSKKLDLSKQEIVRLLKELETFQYEKAATDTKISNLEQDLLKKDRIRREESDETNSLRSMLLEESSDKKKCLKELEDAKEEIKKLKQMIEPDKDNRNLPNPGTSQPEDSTNNIVVVGEEFKKELILKREARQRAIAAVSSEMERLRKELDAEKVAHSETSKILQLLKSAQSQPLAPATDKDESNTQICKRCSDDLSEKVDNVDTNLKEEIEEDEESGCSEAMRLSDLLKISDEVMNNIRFQLEKAEDLYYQLDNLPEVHKDRILSLKKLADDMRETLRSRERQVSDLKDRLSQILVRLGNRTFLDCTDDIRLEHNRQFEDLLNLRRLYEERSKVLTYLKDSAIRDLKDVKSELRTSKNNNEILEEELKKAEEKMDVHDAEVSNLESQLGLSKADCRDLQNQMSVINKLFTQMLLGASSADMDLDRLTQLLQENHDLISDMTRDSGTEAAALPKLLLDLIEQVEGGTKEGKNNANAYNDEKKEEDDLQEENIAHNLPKVWRVLLELIRCHAAETSATSVASSSASDCCYKSVDTPTGPQLVISVSKTYIRLKDLIVEKKSLEKEMNRMKQLNSHLEGKLVEQEKRLSTVSDELTKTWTIVDRMQAQHQQLHTHEKILRYELQQKRKMLQELKQELEYCREKWESARQKNNKTEIEWRSLRREFAARKALSHADSLNNSAESGFSDERDDESDEEVEDEDEKLGKRVRIIGSRKRSRKENSRAATPDTESEQPTDTEVSESKTVSSSTSEQQVLEEESIEEVTNITDEESVPVINAVLETEVLNPLDRALSNVIQNLIKIDETSFTNSSNVEGNEPEKSELMTPGPSSASGSQKSTGHKKKSHKRMAKDWTPQTSYEFEDIENAAKRVFRIEHNLQKANENLTSSQQKEEPVIKSDASSTSKDNSISVPLSSVFSIGPFLAKDAESNKSVALKAENSSLFTTNVSGNGSLTGEKPIIAEPASENESPRLDIIVDDNTSINPPLSAEEINEVKPEEFLKHSESDNQLVVTSSTSRSPDDVFAARAARLKRLEEQADWLVKKMNATSQRGSALSTRLEELHETYGSSPGPPPMPDVLPSFRLQTEISLNPQESPTTSSQIALPSVRKDVEEPSTLDDVP
ncbi:myosin-7 isoform X2 [Belonocnema kinseyi]|uniref:myosin-7 isoform X2 n=1 Tax=Belonocnema kinseyi TaxID=2817044 RepID=UPI00143CEFF6|nr:myosin-7 isoform X2 [Belonocnema kinseyi]